MLLDDKAEGGAFAKFVGDPKLSRVIPGEVPDEYKQCFMRAVGGAALQPITGAGLSGKANGFQPPPSTADQAGFDGGTKCLDVIGSRCGTIGDAKTRQSFKSRWTTASKTPSICGVCCDEIDVHIGSCIDPNTKGTHRYISGHGASGALQCTVCSESDTAGLWAATGGSLPGSTWVLIVFCLVILFKIANFIRKLNAVIALCMSLLTYLQTIDMIHSRTSQDLIVAKDGHTSGLLTLCTPSSDCGWLSGVVNQTVRQSPPKLHLQERV